MFARECMHLLFRLCESCEAKLRFSPRQTGKVALSCRTLLSSSRLQRMASCNWLTSWGHRQTGRATSFDDTASMGYKPRAECNYDARFRESWHEGLTSQHTVMSCGGGGQILRSTAHGWH